MMKKRFLPLLAAAALLIAGTAHAETGDTLSIETAQSGDTVTVEIKIPENSGACIMQFGLDYDPKVMTITDASPGSILKGTLSPLVNRMEEGSVYFVWDSLEPLTAGGSVLTLTFTAAKEVELASAVSFKTDYDYILQDGSFNDIVIEQEETVPETDTPGADTTAPVPEGSGSDATGPAPEGSGLDATEPPAAIVFEKTDVKLDAGSEIKLDPRLDGADTTGEPPAYYSSDESVATVDKAGNVTAVGPGSATITAITTDGSASGEVTVTVEGEAAVETLGTAGTGMRGEAMWLLIAAGVLILVAGGAFLFLKKKA